MIKTAQDAYLLGRQAAMEKLAQMGAPLDESGDMRGNPEVLTFPEMLIQGTPPQKEILGPLSADSPSMFDRGMSNIREAIMDNYPGIAEAGTGEPSTMDKIKAMAAAAGANQMDVLRNIGLTGQGLRDADRAAYDPRAYMTAENLARAGMLGGAAGGTALGGADPRAAAIASAGALGGGVVGGNLGQGVNEAIKALGYGGDRDLATSIGGALGGLGGGLGAGYMAR